MWLKVESEPGLSLGLSRFHNGLALSRFPTLRQDSSREVGLVSLLSARRLSAQCESTQRTQAGGREVLPRLQAVQATPGIGPHVGVGGGPAEGVGPFPTLA